MRLARIAHALMLTIAIIAVSAPSAQARTFDVAMQMDSFQPAAVSMGIGDTVRWTNRGTDFYDTTSDETNPDGSEGLALWASPQLLPLEEFEWDFVAAGTYPYHDTTHEGMSGSVAVAVQTGPSLGGEDTIFTVRVADAEAAEGFVYDIQKRAPGDTFRDWRMGITSGNVTFRAPASGVYAFRARLRRTDTGGSSLYSPARSVTSVDGTYFVMVGPGTSFHPNETHAKLGYLVQWTLGHGNHTTTSSVNNPDGSRGLEWWDSGQLMPDEEFTWRFTAAGGFPYRCLVHPGMRATIWVPVVASPGIGDVGATFRIDVATEPPASGFVYDIQKRDPGERWKDWKLGLTARRVQFRPMAEGTYQFRARLRRLSTEGASLYSEAESIAVG